jgi:hypothetical protein
LLPLLWKAPFRVTGAAALLSLVIEIIQPLLGDGANDLADIAANTLGALLATTILLIRDTLVSRQLDLQRLAKLAIRIIITVGLALGLSIGGANAIRASASEQLDTMFAGTTLADYKRAGMGTRTRSLLEREPHPHLRRLQQQQRCPPTIHLDVLPDHPLRHRPLGQTHGLTTETGDGRQCAQRLR